MRKTTLDEIQSTVFPQFQTQVKSYEESQSKDIIQLEGKHQKEQKTYEYSYIKINCDPRIRVDTHSGTRLVDPCDLQRQRASGKPLGQPSNELNVKWILDLTSKNPREIW